jgi:molybdopterin converting factor subunit 1
MKVAVKLFAAARELAGGSEVVIELPPGADVGELRQALAADLPALSPLASRSLISINAEYASNASLIVEGDELALIPPVSGG